MKRLALIFMLCLLSGVAYADTAGVLASQCRPFMETESLSGGEIYFDSTYDTGVCWGTFEMVQNLIVLTEWKGENSSRIFKVCAPEKSRRLQLIKIFIKYMDEHPEKLHESILNTTLESLRSVWPCPED